MAKKLLPQTKWFIPGFGRPEPPSEQLKCISNRIFDVSGKSKTPLPRLIGTGLNDKDFERLNNNSVEVALIGRSNVGKSSLINALLSMEGSSKHTKKNKAHVSRTPGKTTFAQFYGINERLSWKGKKLPDFGVVLVDLPGYGFGVGGSERLLSMGRTLENYFESRSHFRLLANVFMLVDCRRGLMESDLLLLADLKRAAIPVQLVLTKLDKANAVDLAQTIGSDDSNPFPADAVVRSVLSCVSTGPYVNLYPQVLGVSTKLGGTGGGCLGIRQLRREIAWNVFSKSDDRVRELLLKGR